MKNHLLEKLHPNLTEKSYGAFKIRWEKIQNLLVAHHMLGVPLVTEKKLVSKKKLNYFSKYDT